MKLHAGCGKHLASGWLNVDKKKGDVISDLSKEMPFPDSYFTHIFHEHFLEHLEYPSEANLFVSECYRVLKPHGIMRVSVPDTEYTIKAYFEKNDDYFRRCQELWHPEWCTTMMESVNYHFRQDGQHKFAYDYSTLEKLLYKNGFEKIVKSSFNDSIDLGFDIDTRDDPGTLIVNCRKRLENDDY